jgi:hypothetical protein
VPHFGHLAVGDDTVSSAYARFCCLNVCSPSASASYIFRNIAKAQARVVRTHVVRHSSTLSPPRPPPAPRSAVDSGRQTPTRGRSNRNTRARRLRVPRHRFSSSADRSTSDPLPSHHPRRNTPTPHPAPSPHPPSPHLPIPHSAPNSLLSLSLSHSHTPSFDVPTPTWQNSNEATKRRVEPGQQHPIEQQPPALCSSHQRPTPPSTVSLSSGQVARVCVFVV